jgi:hypothetical protein
MAPTAADVKKASKLKRQEKARVKAGAVQANAKDDEVDVVAEEVEKAAHQLKELSNLSTSKAAKDADLAKARNSTGEMHDCVLFQVFVQRFSQEICEKS